jgi:hypothetical protein
MPPRALCQQTYSYPIYIARVARSSMTMLAAISGCYAGKELNAIIV